MKTRIITIMVALMAVLAHATAQDLDEKYATDLLKAGTEAPDMRVGTGKDGKAVRLSDLKGKYVLINFWASWCPDCRRETPALQRLWQKYGEKGLQIAVYPMTPTERLGRSISLKIRWSGGNIAN